MVWARTYGTRVTIATKLRHCMQYRAVIEWIKAGQRPEKGSLAVMSVGKQPKRMSRASIWSADVEEAYRFQIAGYRDEHEYLHVTKYHSVDRWPHNNYVKKLRRRDGCFYYFNRRRECPDKDLRKVKLYTY